ncbi:MAG: DUF262 domain-containing protein [Planctomycetia bacterium]|nr:DUF262 domain-containing protein [Planctomycetia bacterium]
MAKAEATVEDLVSMVERGELRLPEMQRQYVWQATRVRDLMDSLYRGYPSGAILIWETDEAVPLRDFAVQQQQNPYATTKLLLDGQQRLTSLSAVLRAEPIKVRGRKRPIELLFNLEHPDQLTLITEASDENDLDEELEVDSDLESDEDADEETPDASEDELLRRFNQMTFLVSTKKIEAMPTWVKVSDVFRTSDNTPFLKKAGVTNLDDPRCEKYSQRLNKLRGIRKYHYRMDILERNLSYEEVTEIFVRVNSLGAKLRSSDLAMAQITAKWRESLKIFEKFQEDCSELGFDVDLGIHVKNLVSHTTGQSRFHTVGRLLVDKLQEGWTDAKEGMHFAINFLKSNVGIESPALLSSEFLLIALGYLGHHKKYHLTALEEADLRYWVLTANTKGRYSRGSSETILDQDLSRIRQDGNVAGLIETIQLQFGRLDIVPGELESRNARSAFFKTMFLAFRKDGAKDWTSNLAISLSHSGKQHKLQFHHIFPRAVLRDMHRPHIINDIANLAFIGGKTNRRISSKPPIDYLPSVIEKQGEHALRAQCIPTEPRLWQIENYLEFLNERRKLIAIRLNEYLALGRIPDNTVRRNEL